MRTSKGRARYACFAVILDSWLDPQIVSGMLASFSRFCAPAACPAILTGVMCIQPIIEGPFPHWSLQWNSDILAGRPRTTSCNVCLARYLLRLICVRLSLFLRPVSHSKQSDLFQCVLDVLLGLC